MTEVGRLRRLLLRAGILVCVLWYSCSDSPSNAMYAWAVLAVAVFFWLVLSCSHLLASSLLNRSGFAGELRACE